MRQWIIKWISLVFLMAVGSFITAECWLPGIGQWLSPAPQVRRVDAIVVLGGGYPRRILHGVALYQQGLAPELWHTGNITLPGTTTSHAQAAARLAQARGVPPEAIHLLTTTSTWEDGREIAALARQKNVQNILIVTDWWHSRRALCAVQQHIAGSGINLYVDPPRDPSSTPETWWQHEAGRRAVFSEMAKLGYYWGRYGMVPWRC